MLLPLNATHVLPILAAMAIAKAGALPYPNLHFFVLTTWNCKTFSQLMDLSCPKHGGCALKFDTTMAIYRYSAFPEIVPSSLRLLN